MRRKAVLFLFFPFFPQIIFFHFHEKREMALNLYSNDASYFVQYSLVALRRNVSFISWIYSIHTCIIHAPGLFIHNSLVEKLRC